MKTHFFLKTAYLLGQESKCVSKKVGCLVVRDNRNISMGYNGTPAGYENCCDHFINYNPIIDREAHHEWSRIYEIHAEQNAIDFAAKFGLSIDGCDLYSILQPCDECLKSIIAAGIKKIYYMNSYDKATLDNKLWDRIEHEQVMDEELRQWVYAQEIFNTRFI
jgi:dCMP deaminase